MSKYGEALTKAGWVDEAIEIFERANKLEAKSNSQLYGSWARALSSWERLAPGKRLAAAEAMLLAAESESMADESRDGRDARIYRIWGEILNDHDQPVDAKEKYRIAVALDHQDALAYQNWGRILLDKDDDLAGAIEKLGLAVRKDKQLPEAYYYLGEALLRQGDVVAAVEAFENAARFARPHHPAKKWKEMAGTRLKEPDRIELARELAPTKCPPDPNTRPILEAAAMPEPAYLMYP